ncbi:ubiquitin carboxyl-terminal hydrolase calypso isoform X2 [Schistocerca cancellata]|uniref:ubiquitin carboxyl-terminal hydrolase calypso isoform X2 n=1 Tax=Schistocerca cancellata TaxID=274614 RepID=UPI002118D3C8|nr:ubiquitin carboxyl-terminal hydrolase calypso isoform X2 [Schistocerca cancellata]
MPVDINRLTEGWLELESDPGLFTLLLEDFGVKGVQVEEIYDLQKSLEGPVYGFIFLFRWIEERRSRRKIVDEIDSFVKDEEVVNNIFFAQQMVPNSCATHALLSVLLNCPDIHLGATLSRLKAHTSGMCPENKGWAIGNTPELAKAHNSHAMPQAKRRLDKSSSSGGVSTGRYTGEAFHFVSYVPIHGKLFELDGLKPFPMDHGPWGEKEDWTEKFRRVITDRLGITAGEPYHDIRFNLMAVVPDRRIALTRKIKMLKTNRQIVLEALQQLVKLTQSEQHRHRQQREEEGDEKPSASAVTEDEERDDVPGGDGTDGDAEADGLSPARDSEQSGGTDCSSLEAPEGSPEKASASPQQRRQQRQQRQQQLCPLDYSTPLTIQISPAPSSSSTDTSSEVGSAFNSPTQGWSWNSGQNSPTSAKDFKKFVVIRVGGPSSGSSEEKMDSPTGSRVSLVGPGTKRPSGGGDAAVPPGKKLCPETPASSTTSPSSASSTPAASPSPGHFPAGCGEVQSGPADGTSVGSASAIAATAVEHEKKVDLKMCSKYPELFEPHKFAPKDLLALLKNLENEIGVCELSLQEENDKRNKYKVDDCRRTHNYDEFICTFLSMLAQQGQLADLVLQHQVQQHKKSPAPARTLQRPPKKVEATTPPTPPAARPSPTRRRRGARQVPPAQVSGGVAAGSGSHLEAASGRPAARRSHYSGADTLLERRSVGVLCGTPPT